jgi:ribulose-5-phosphate 4-epimerase/fuculose-1-phosphate aldolase
MTVTTLSPAQPAGEAAREARLDLAAAFRWAARLDFHEGTCNHFSLALPGSADRYLINPHGPHFSEMRASDLLVVDGEGRLVEGRYPIEATAFFIHSRIHKARPEAACVLHTHMPYATALAVIEGGRLEMCSQNALRFFGRVGYDDDYRGLALDEAEGDRMVRALDANRVLFLQNHGVIVVAPTVAQAFDDLYYLERAAQLQVIAMSTGRSLKLVPDEIAAATCRQMEDHRELYADTHFGALRRMLARDEPEFMD